MVNWEKFRDQMEITSRYIYLNHAALGPLPYDTKAKLDSINQSQVYGNVEWNHQQWNEIIEGFPTIRQEIASLINANPSEIAMTTSTSHGISNVLTGLSWKNNPNNAGIILNDMEFASNSFPYQQISKKFSIPIHLVKARFHHEKKYLDIEDFKAIFEKNRIQLVGLSHVQFSNGYRSDLKEITKLAHSHGALVLVDAIQSIGALNVDVQILNIDFMSSACFKWCLGPVTTGFMFIKKDLISQLEPIFVSNLADIKEDDLRYHIFKPKSDARRFHTGLFFHCLPVLDSIRLLNRFNIRNIENQIIKVTDYLVEQLKSQLPQIRIKSVRKSENKSGIIKISFPSEFKLNKIFTDLRNKQIIVTMRDNALRISPHCYNTKEEIDTLIIELSKSLEKN